MPRERAARRRVAEERMDFRLSPDHKALIEKAAAYSGESLTGFAIGRLVEEARRVVREHEALVLSARDRDRFLALLEAPPAPTEALRRAARLQRARIARSE
jgi:uncharacterized protein (DUF1778 family)